MYDTQQTVNLIKQRAKLKKISIGEMLSFCELSKNALSSMQSRGSWLQANNLAKIADYLDCSVDYLLGRTDIPEINKGNIINITDATPHKLVAFGGMQNEEVEPPIEEKTT